ncbi:TPA: cysteine-rich KTR domain-containing protein, partial [Streptococcus pneumoniae]
MTSKLTASTCPVCGNKTRLKIRED